RASGGRAGESPGGGGLGGKGGPGAGAVGGEGKFLHHPPLPVRPAPAEPATSADSAARRQRRGAGDRGQPPRADRLGVSLGRSGARRLRSLSRAGAKARLDPRPRALPSRAARLRRRDERARPRGGRAPPELLLAEAAQLSPPLDGAGGAVAAGAP